MSFGRRTLYLGTLIIVHPRSIVKQHLTYFNIRLEGGLSSFDLFLTVKWVGSKAFCELVWSPIGVLFKFI